MCNSIIEINFFGSQNTTQETKEWMKGFFSCMMLSIAIASSKSHQECNKLFFLRHLFSHHRVRSSVIWIWCHAIARTFTLWYEKTLLLYYIFSSRCCCSMFCRGWRVYSCITSSLHSIDVYENERELALESRNAIICYLNASEVLLCAPAHDDQSRWSPNERQKAISARENYEINW